MAKLLKNHWFILGAACFAIFFVNLDALYVNIMEARNFTTAREMLNDGNWILTTLNGQPRYQKPPLPTWMTAVSAAVFGLKSLFALRLPAALLGSLVVFIKYIFTRKLFQNKDFGLTAALVTATSFYVVSAGRDGNWDIFTHGFMMVCILYLYKFFTESSRQYRNILIAALFFGFSFMSKGPVSMYALLLPFLIAYGFVYRYKGLKRRLLPIFTFLVVATVLSGWWYWYTYIFDAEAVAAITKRETSNWTGYNVRPIYYYWSFFTQSGVWTIIAFISLLYPYLKERVFNKQGYRFSFWWTMASLILLSVIPEKKSRYLLPVLIPLALNTAFYLEYLFRKFAEIKDKRETIPVYFNFGLIAAIGLVFPIGGYLLLKDNLNGKWVWFVLLAISLLALGIFIIKFLRKKQIKKVFYATVAFIAAILCFGMPLAKTLTVNPEFKGYSELNEWQSEENVEVYELTNFTPELIWDYGDTIDILLQEDEEIRIPEEERFGVLVAKEDEGKFRNTFFGFNFKRIARYDMNPKDADDRSHKTRLYRDLYLVTRN